MKSGFIQTTAEFLRGPSVVLRLFQQSGAAVVLGSTVSVFYLFKTQYSESILYQLSQCFWLSAERWSNLTIKWFIWPLLCLPTACRSLRLHNRPFNYSGARVLLQILRDDGLLFVWIQKFNLQISGVTLRCDATQWGCIANDGRHSAAVVWSHIKTAPLGFSVWRYPLYVP